MSTMVSMWLIAALLIAGLEMLSGTFYLLMVALGCGVGGLVAYLGGESALQYAAAAVTAVAGTMLVRYYRKQSAQRPAEPMASNVGLEVIAQNWKSDTAVRVRFRGSDWDAELDGPQPGHPQQLVIVGQRGNTLVVAPAMAASQK